MSINPQSTKICHLAVHKINLYKKCKKLEEYSIFVDKVHKALANANKEDYKKILTLVIDDCIKNNILADILIRERSRIMECFLSHFDADEYVDFIKQDSYEDGVNHGIKQGITQGINQGVEQTTIKFYLSAKISKQEALSSLNMSESDFDEAVSRYKASNE